jgi:multiple sugar transport system substrate-binding protein
VTAVTEAPVAVPETVVTGGKTRVAIWHTFTKDQEAYLVKTVTDFNGSQDKVEVQLLSQPNQGFTQAVRSAVSEGIGPDIIFNPASVAAGYVKAGLVADLSQYIYDASIGIEGFDGSLAKGIMDGEVNGFEDGLIHYLPAYTTGPILFYNKTLFEELKLAVPTTWAEFEAAAKIIKEKKNIPALGFDALTDLVQMLIMETPGAGYIDVANKTVLFDTPEVRARIQWLVDMVKEGYFLLQPSGDYFSSDFNSGIVASYFGSCAGYPYIEPNGFEFAMAPVPADTWYPSWNRGPIVFYYKDDARAQAAYEFVKYFISADVNAGWVEAVTALAPYSWTKDTGAYKAFIAQDTLAVQSLKAVEANLDVAGSLPAVDGANIVRTALQDAVKKAALGEMTVDQAWTEAVKISNAALKGE